MITATQTERVPATLFGPSTTRSVQSLGSGFVIDRNGDIVTNDHVVAGAKDVRVGFSGGKSYPATVDGTDATTDLAVVRVRAPSAALHPLAFDDLSRMAVGDQVYAIGNPFGLDRTMTAGIMSATGRPSIEWRAGLWLAPYLLGLGVVAYLSSFDASTKSTVLGLSGPVDALPFGWDVLVMAAFSIAIYALAVRLRLPSEAVEERVGDLAAEAQEIEATLAPAR